MGPLFSKYRERLRRLLNRDVFVIYTMGKVGSTSLEESLPQAFHTHTLYGNPPSLPFHLSKYGRVGVFLRRYTAYPLKRLMIRSRPEVRIITFYRDPVDRNPSMFMQDLPFWLSSYIRSQRVSTRVEDQALLVDAYKTVFPHDYPYEWIRDELSRFTGISTQDLSLGDRCCRVVARGRYSVFIGRCEAFEESLPQLQEFVGDASKLSGGRANRGSAKWYGPIYENFLRDLRADETIEFSERFRRMNGYSDVP